MKKRGLIAIFLVATMLLSAMPAFAAEHNDQQIVNASQEMLDSERSADGLVSVNAQAFATAKENLFRVRLDVTTSENLREMTVKEGDAAVLIIVDKSTSMNQYGPIVQDTASLSAVLTQYPQLGLSVSDFPVTTSYDDKSDVLAVVDELVNGALETLQANQLAARLALEEELKQKQLEEELKQKQLEEEQKKLEEAQKPTEASPADGVSPGDELPETGAPTQGEDDKPSESGAPVQGEDDKLPETGAPAQDEDDKLPETGAPAQDEDNKQSTTNAPVQSNDNSTQTGETAEGTNVISTDLLHQSSLEAVPQSAILTQIRDCYHYRAWFERQAVMDFLDSYTNGITDDVSRYFALGTFHQDASIKADWTKLGSNWRTGDVGAAATDYSFNAEAWTSNDQTGSKLTYTNGSGTNVAGAYLLARNMMHVGFDAETGYFREEGIDNLQVILITDGEPSAGLASKDPVDDLHYGFNVTLNDAGAVTAYTLKDNAKIKGARVSDSQLSPVFAELETVASTVAADPLFDLTAVRYGNSDRNSLFDGGGAGYCDSYREVDDAGLAQLLMSDIFQQTVPSVSTVVYPWTVTLPMGQFMAYEKEYTRESNFTVNKSSFTNNALTWDLTRSQPITTENTDSGSQYAYRYEFLARLDNTQSGFVAQQAYDVGDETVLTYNIKTENGGVKTFTEGSLTFDVPQVQGYLGELVFDKVDGNGVALGGATFTLALDGEDNTKSWSAQSGSGGKVRFSVPSGHSYTLKETLAPAGYNGSNDSYDVSVSYADLQVMQGGSLVNSLRVVNTVIPGNPGGSTDDGPDDGPTVVIPDNDVPMGDAPAGVTDIPESEVPLAELPSEEETTEIPEEEVPLAEAPKTGDLTGIWTLVSFASGAGALWLLLSDRKRRSAEGQ